MTAVEPQPPPADAPGNRRPPGPGTTIYPVEAFEVGGINLEQFLERCLETLAFRLDARRINLWIRNPARPRGDIHAESSKEHDGRRFAILPTGPRRTPPKMCRPGGTPRFLLRSQYLFPLRLGPRWEAMARVEYGGIRMLDPGRYRRAQGEMDALSEALRVVLMQTEIAALEQRLTDKTRENRSLQEMATDLSKEVYCMGGLSTVLGQTYDVQQILDRLLETTMPLLGAEFSAIHVPEANQCTCFQRKGSRCRKLPSGECNPCMKAYFDDQRNRNQPDSDRIPLRFITAADPAFPAELTSCFESLGIRSAFEFRIRYRNELFGMGLVGFSGETFPPEKHRILMIALNMTGLFLENIWLMRNLVHQLRQKSKTITDMEKRQQFFANQLDRSPFPTDSPFAGDKILGEIERSRKMALLAELASGVAHQIRNPLNNLLGGLHLLADEGIDPSERRDLVSQMTGRVDDMNRMLNEFIQYTRMPQLNLSVESLNTVLENAIRSFRGWLELANVALEAAYDPALPPTKVDLFLINQAFHNILKNGLEAMGKDGRFTISTRKLTVKHGPEPHLEFAEISFRDTGPGVSRGEARKIFTPFYSRKDGGMGLGLAVVDHVARAHGGGVRFRSEPGAGARVILYIPIR